MSASYGDRARDYFRDHGVDHVVAERCGVREERGALVYPYDGFERRRPLAGDRTLQPGGVPLTAWWLAGRPKSVDAVLVCEGEPDGLAALTALPQSPLAEFRDLPVLAVPGTGYPVDRLVEELRQVGAGIAYLAFDADDPSRRYCKKAIDALRAVGVRPVAVELPEETDLADNLAREEQAGEWLANLLADSEATSVEPAADRDRGSDPGRDDERNGGGPRVGLVWASTVAPERTRWAWRERLPLGAVSLLVGRGGLGKSQVLCDLSARITRGTVEGDLRGERCPVLIASAEDAPAAVLVPRLIAAGADLSHVAFLDGLTLPDELPGLAERAEQTGARLLVIDPLVAYIPSEHSTHRDQHVRRVLAPLAQLAEHHDLATVGVVHLNKGETRETLDRVGGSVGLGAAARSVLILGRDPDDEDGDRGNLRVLAHAKSNYGRHAASLRLRIETREILDGDGQTIETSRAVVLGEHAAEANELLSAPTAEERSERDDAREFLEAELADGPRAAKDVIARGRAQGLSRATLYRARAALKLESVQIGGGADAKRSAWALPDAPSHPGAQVEAGLAETERETEPASGSVSYPPDVRRSPESPAVEPKTYVSTYVSERDGGGGETKDGGATSHVSPGSRARAREPVLDPCPCQQHLDSSLWRVRGHIDASWTCATCIPPQRRADEIHTWPESEPAPEMATLLDACGDEEALIQQLVREFDANEITPTPNPRRTP